MAVGLHVGRARARDLSGRGTDMSKDARLARSGAARHAHISTGRALPHRASRFDQWKSLGANSPDGQNGSRPAVSSASMRPRFANTVSSLCYSLVLDEAQRVSVGDSSAVSAKAVVNFVLGQCSRMPDYLRLPLVLLTLAFDLAGLRHGGTLFHRMDAAAKRRQIAAWRCSRFGIARDFIRLYDSLAIFGWYSMTALRSSSLDVGAEASKLECHV
jgi:hypothetical protein